MRSLSLSTLNKEKKKEKPNEVEETNKTLLTLEPPGPAGPKVQIIYAGLSRPDARKEQKAPKARQPKRVVHHHCCASVRANPDPDLRCNGQWHSSKDGRAGGRARPTASPSLAPTSFLPSLSFPRRHSTAVSSSVTLPRPPPCMLPSLAACLDRRPSIRKGHSSQALTNPAISCSLTPPRSELAVAVVVIGVHPARPPPPNPTREQPRQFNAFHPPHIPLSPSLSSYSGCREIDR